MKQAETETQAQANTQANTQTGAQVIVRSLIKHDVDVVFGYPGGQVLDIYDELYKHEHQIKHVITAHEQGAAHAADGYARATGKVGVVVATSGPGATNLVTGIATAYLDSIPLVAITGNVATALLGKDSFQEIDIFGVTIPVTKHNYIVKDVNELPRILAEAFAIAKSGRPGPVLIDVPRDVQTALTKKALPEPYVAQSPVAENHLSADTLAKAAQLIAGCERPYIYCGGGVLTANAGEQLASFAELLDAPIGCSIMGLTAIPASHPRNLGMTGMHGREASIRAQAQADLVIAVGARFSDRATGNKAHYTANKKFIHIDIDPAEIDKNITADAALVGEIPFVLEQLSTRLEAVVRPQWQAELAAMRAEEKAHADIEPAPTPEPNAQTLIREVRKRTNDNTIVVTDVGQHQMWVAQNYRFEKPRRFLTSGGLGTMGYGLGAAIGACLGSFLAAWAEPKETDTNPDAQAEARKSPAKQAALGASPAKQAALGASPAPQTAPQKTVLFTGDGSFGMNLNELATAVAQQLPLVIIIMNNGVLGMVRQWQTLFYDKRYSHTTLGRATDFAAVARAFGAEGCKVETSEQLSQALDTAFAATGPYLIDCVIGADDKVFPMIPPGGTVNDMLLG
ncbi:MAG: biosynthetic-type acetolactate synthase large subunit [Coriobacteriales bacterium]|jgi:acetolactate synthase-1/2/3 large subunit|nr:biosynthetic-type acetolactate synthase large subunit [Coriobacteriales bacterium]